MRWPYEPRLQVPQFSVWVAKDRGEESPLNPYPELEDIIKTKTKGLLCTFFLTSLCVRAPLVC